MKTLLLKVKSSDFFNSNSNTATTHKYQDIVLSYFSQTKTKLVQSAPKILQSICNGFVSRYGNLTFNSRSEEAALEETATKSDILLQLVCKALNTASWIVP